MEKFKRDFAVFILTHGRANNVKTIDVLKHGGYTGKTYIVIDDEDEQEELYRKNFGDNVLRFCKQDYIDRTDRMNLEDMRKVIVYARNCVNDFAKELGLTHYLVLDDDYTSMMWRYTEGERLKGKQTKRLDDVFKIFCDFLDKSNALTVAMAQGGDYIGGASGGAYNKGILRKAMNSFFCRTDRPFDFLGAINEDVNTYTSLGNKGELFFTITKICLTQVTTQKNKGGMTDTYHDNGTYIKSFSTVMLCPSCVKIKKMGNKYMRIHHMIKWKYAVPQIISDRWKK